MVIVLDTNILVAATLSPFGASFQILTMIPQRRFDLLLSVPLMLEYEEVLKRDDMRAQSHLTVEEVDVLLDADGVPDATDNCVNDANPGQQDDDERAPHGGHLDTAPP